VRPETSTIGAPPKCSLKRSGSMVALQLEVGSPRQDAVQTAE
jgi:hypothetical protein